MMLVCIFLLVGLGKYKGINGLFDGILALAVEISSSRDGVGECGNLGGWIGGVSTVAESEGGHLGGGIGSVVAGKFGHGQKGVPVILVVPNKYTKHVLKGAVGLFCLAIGLGIIGNGHCETG